MPVRHSCGGSGLRFYSPKRSGDWEKERSSQEGDNAQSDHRADRRCGDGYDYEARLRRTRFRHPERRAIAGPACAGGRVVGVGDFRHSCATCGDDTAASRASSPRTIWGGRPLSFKFAGLARAAVSRRYPRGAPQGARRADIFSPPRTPPPKGWGRSTIRRSAWAATRTPQRASAAAGC